MLDEDGDLLIVNGDFVIGESEEQHIVDILNANKGFYKEFPHVGVGIMQYYKSSGMQDEIKMNIQLQLESDNFTINEIVVGDMEKMQVYIDASRDI